jgi:hypothetical protein
MPCTALGEKVATIWMNVTAHCRVFLPILEKLKFALDSSILHADEEAKFFEVRRPFSFSLYYLNTITSLCTRVQKFQFSRVNQEC